MRGFAKTSLCRVKGKILTELDIWNTAVLVYLATTMQVLGFLFRTQLILRLLVLLGTVFYVAFYYFHPVEPIWDAIYGSSLIGLANIIGLGFLIYSRVPLGMDETERELFDAMGGLEPGMFRKLMAIGDLWDSHTMVELTHEGRKPESLFFVLRGQTEVRKGVSSFKVRDRVFIGEVAFLTGATASASTSLLNGGVYVQWDSKRLRALCERRPALRQAFEALISRDLASKVATGVQPDNLRVINDGPVQVLRQNAAIA